MSDNRWFYVFELDPVTTERKTATMNVFGTRKNAEAYIESALEEENAEGTFEIVELFCR